MTLRQLWVRIRALPAESPLHRALRAVEEKAEHDRANMSGSRIDNALALVGGGGRG